jgi:hypothetical protein
VAAATEDVADPDAVVGRAEGPLGKEDDGSPIAQDAIILDFRRAGNQGSRRARTEPSIPGLAGAWLELLVRRIEDYGTSAM